jgi:hypothetical protein
VAPGGMGKTSLCLSIAKTLHATTDHKSSVLLIQAEPLKRYISEHGQIYHEITSLYELYHVYARYSNNANVLDQSTFELAFLGGNLIILIDGLDEFVSLFDQGFDLQSFMRSLADSYSQLGSSSVLMTCRENDVIREDLLNKTGILKHTLLGFDLDSCRKYLQKRFRSYDLEEQMISNVLDKICSIKLRTPDERIVPFFVDILATTVEDDHTNGRLEEFLNKSDIETPFPSNNTVTDHIILSILRREEIRQNLDIPISEVLDLFCGLVADYSERWPIKEINDRLELLYEDRAPELSLKVLRNPLLCEEQDYVYFRYGFLVSYFETLLLITGITRRSLEAEFIKVLARMMPDSMEIKDVGRYFSTKHSELTESSSYLILKLCDQIRNSEKSSNARHDKIQIKRLKQAISSLVRLCFYVKGGNPKHNRELILSLYSISHGADPASIKSLYIFGDLPPIDFSGLTIVGSLFDRFTKFLSCKFEGTKFISCSFSSCFDPSIPVPSSLSRASFDQSCDTGDLRDALAIASSTNKSDRSATEREARAFLNSFFKGDRFTDKSKQYIKFSTIVPGLSSKRFDKLVASGYISIKVEKTVGTFYVVSEHLLRSARRFLVDNLVDKKMLDFFEYIESLH